MSIISDAIQAKCLAFSDRIIKLNDFLLVQAVAAHENYKKSKIKEKGKQTSSFLHKTSDISVAAVPVYLQSVSNLCNQLLRAGTSIGANNAEASSAISKADFKSKSYIAWKVLPTETARFLRRRCVNWSNQCLKINMDSIFSR